jgi:hypothetical protein
MAGCNVRTTKLRSYCTACDSRKSLIVDHTACARGCYDCDESFIDCLVKIDD